MNDVKSYFMMAGEEKEMPHKSVSDARKWLGYMVAMYGVKPLRIEAGEEVVTKNLVEKW